MRAIAIAIIALGGCANQGPPAEKPPLDFDALLEEWPELRGLAVRASDPAKTFPGPEVDVYVLAPSGPRKEHGPAGWTLSQAVNQVDLDEELLLRSVAVVRRDHRQPLTESRIIVCDLLAGEDVSLQCGDVVLLDRPFTFGSRISIWNTALKVIRDPEFVPRLYEAYHKGGKFRQP